MISLISGYDTQWGVGGWQQWRKEGQYRGKREVGGVVRKEKNGMNQTSLLYVNL